MTSEGRLERAPGIRPWPTIWRRIDAAARRIFPAATTLAAVVLLAFPLPIPAKAELQHGIAMASVYFWTLYRPNSMKPSVCFVIGLLVDLLGPEPPGVTMVILLAAHGIAMRSRFRLIRQGFIAVWSSFVAVAAGCCAAEWALTSSLDLRLLPATPALFELVLAAGFYPLLATVFARAHAGIAAPERA